MMQSIQGRLKMEFPHFNCFPAITKLIAGLHALHPKSRANFVVVLKNILMLLTYSHFTCVISNECVLKRLY